MPDRVFVIVRLATLLGAAIVAGGCETRAPAPIQRRAADYSAISAAHRQIRERTQRRFAKASFLSPQPESDAGIPLWMAPLLVHEYSLSAEDDARWARFGAVSVDAKGLATVDDQRPTVYLSATDVMIGSRSLKQITCLWFYPPPPAADQRIPYRGFRMTLGSRGYAVVWDVLSSESTERTMFVAKPVEQAAVGEFGGPLPGRQFAVEPPLAEHPEVVVPRVVGDGPQPMGPFVYLDAASLSVSTLICRCEPSQVDEFPCSGHYVLRRVGDLDEVFGGAPAPPNLSLPWAHVSPEGVLRLPAEL